MSLQGAAAAPPPVPPPPPPAAAPSPPLPPPPPAPLATAALSSVQLAAMSEVVLLRFHTGDSSSVDRVLLGELLGEELSSVVGHDLQPQSIGSGHKTCAHHTFAAHVPP
ncbi:hypothetical protein V5799_008082 [Amblyomma americanum]|uniref:Uncharacterized protein n=1 Tax=Amblyomma americanum TaxID=6943 RepID=A0AAQ4FFH3_AMBAM